MSYIPEDDMYYITRSLDKNAWGKAQLLSRTNDFKSVEEMGIIALPNNRVPCIFQGNNETDYCEYYSKLKKDSSLCAKLINDLVFTGAAQTIENFSGIIDGNNHKIKADRPLISNAKNGTVIKNLIVEGMISGGNHVAAFIRYTDNTAESVDTVTLENCVNLATVYGNDVRVAGLVGYVNPNDTLNMTNCYSYGSIMGEKNDVAPLAVLNSAANSNFINCYYLKDSARQNATDAVNPVTASAKTEMQFASGEVAFLLSDAFGQKLTEPRDKYPVFYTANNHVYKTLSGYSNENEGTGTVENPYIINNKSDLIAFRNIVNSIAWKTNINAKLMSDIDLGGEEWMMIGVEGKSTYTGVFDGNNHTISNWIISGVEWLGFFGDITDATIKNLKLQGSVSGTNTNVGGLVGQWNGNCIIENCIVDVKVSAKNACGGFIGWGISGSTGKILNSVFIGSVVGSTQADPFTADGRILKENCYYITNCATKAGMVNNPTTSVGKTVEQFESGEVTYLLGTAFGQALVGINRDNYPVFFNGINKVILSNQIRAVILEPNKM